MSSEKVVRVAVVENKGKWFVGFQTEGPGQQHTLRRSFPTEKGARSWKAKREAAFRKAGYTVKGY